MRQTMANSVHPIQILLVEDNEGDILLTSEALKGGKINNDLYVVKDGYEAIMFLHKEGKYIVEPTPDLVLLDINLPKVNGQEVLTNMKIDDKLKHIPVIMLTTSSSESDILKSYRNYANCYITKPHDVSDYHDLVESIENFWMSLVQLPTKFSSI
jgi:CheY-like chemotaxis protein